MDEQAVSIMDPASIAAAFAGSQAGQLQAALSAKVAKMNLNQDAAIAQMLDAAAQSVNPLANVASGIGQNLDVTA
jgi:hypothetical protein